MKKENQKKVNKGNKSLLKFWIILLLPFCLSGAIPDNNMINIKFEVNGKIVNINGKFNICFMIGKKTIDPMLLMNGFIVPNFGDAKEVDVLFTYKNYKLYFKGLPIQKFETDWILGIDKKPFEGDKIPNIQKDEIKRIRYIHFIKFIPKQGGDGTQVKVFIYKK